MLNKRIKKSNQIISKIEFIFTQFYTSKPYEVCAEGTFVSDTGSHSFNCDLYISQMPIADTVTVFGTFELRTPDGYAQEVNFDFPMHKNLRDLPHAVTYGIMRYGMLDEEVLIDYPTEFIEKFWEEIDKQNA